VYVTSAWPEVHFLTFLQLLDLLQCVVQPLGAFHVRLSVLPKKPLTPTMLCPLLSTQGHKILYLGLHTSPHHWPGVPSTQPTRHGHITCNGNNVVQESSIYTYDGQIKCELTSFQLDFLQLQIQREGQCQIPTVTCVLLRHGS
jgi:hypothetical protein